MARKRRVLSSQFKAKVAMAAAKEDKTLSELAGQFKVHGNQVSAWKKTLLERAGELFRSEERFKVAGESPVDHALAKHAPDRVREVAQPLLLEPTRADFGQLFEEEPRDDTRAFFRRHLPPSEVRQPLRIVSSIEEPPALPEGHGADEQVGTQREHGPDTEVEQVGDAALLVDHEERRRESGLPVGHRHKPGSIHSPTRLRCCSPRSGMGTREGEASSSSFGKRIFILNPETTLARSMQTPVWSVTSLS